MGNAVCAHLREDTDSHDFSVEPAPHIRHILAANDFIITVSDLETGILTPAKASRTAYDTREQDDTRYGIGQSSAGYLGFVLRKR